MPFQRRIQSFKDLPIPYEQRKKTDIFCCLFGFIFGIILFIIACAVMNSTHLQQINNPADKTGLICSVDKAKDGKNYPMLYFDDFDNPLVNRYCIKECPKKGQSIECAMGPCSLDYYENSEDNTMIGSYCMPKNEKLKDKLIKNSGMQIRYDTKKALSILLSAIGISAALALVWMILVQFFPKIMVWVAIILAIILLLIFSILFFANSGGKLRQAIGWAIILAIIGLVLAAFLIFYAIKSRKSLKLCGIFLENATKMLKQNIITFLYIPVFFALTTIFLVIIVFQFVAYASISQPHFQLTELYYQNEKSFILMFLLVIETLWGLSFLRSAFDYCVSGCAVQWYFDDQINFCEPMKFLVYKNFGSVISGSLLTAFFYIPSLIVSFFFSEVDCCLCNFFDILRGDIYPYIYLTGSTYCTSARQCQYLCERSDLCNGSQSANTIYSLAARIVLSITTVLITYWMGEGLLEENAYSLLGAFFVGLYLTCYFVDIHIDVSEALLVTFLCEYDLEKEDYTEMECRESLKNPIQALSEWEKRIRE